MSQRHHFEDAAPGGITPGQVIDGYEVLRLIGQGGFGMVWLVRSTVTGSFLALKHIRTFDAKLLEKELQALEKFKQAAPGLRDVNLVPIEHVNLIRSGLFYVMPLADGAADCPPTDEAWIPDTLAQRITVQRSHPVWFNSEQIIAWMTPLIEAVAGLTKQGLVHRDVKPENVLFLGGQPFLGDISLLTNDANTISQRGTPGYVAPSWYLESGGHPDMWGLTRMALS